MKTNIEKIKQKLLYPSQYALVPDIYENTPLPFPEWEIQDENGTGTGKYWSPESLSEELGNLLVLVKKVKYTEPASADVEARERYHFLMRYALDFDTYPAFVQFMQSMGLSDARDNGDGALKTVAEIDFTSFDDKQFIVCPSYMAVDIPDLKPTLEDVNV